MEEEDKRFEDYMKEEEENEFVCIPKDLITNLHLFETKQLGVLFEVIEQAYREGIRVGKE